MSRYVEVDALKEQMLKYGFHSADQTVTEFVEDTLPTADVVEKEKWDRLLENSIILAGAIQTYQSADVVEVVRCKDCKYYYSTEIATASIMCSHMHEDDYCSYGERREDDKRGSD